MMAKRFHNLTEAQERALSLIAINEHPGASRKTLQVLVDKGLVEKTQRTIYGKGSSVIDRMPLTVDWYVMPLAVHAEWCHWCSEHYSEDVDR